MAVSSAPVVKRALLTLLEEAFAAETDVQVVYAHPGTALSQEAIYFHRTISNDRVVTLSLGGPQSREEKYTLELIVEITQDGNSYDMAEERCWAVIAKIEEAVHANPGIAAVAGWMLFQAAEIVPFWSENGQTVAQATCSIEVTNRK